jgi:predicted secreted hydrolase
VKLTPGQTWTSPYSHGTYTLGWKIEIPPLKLALTVEPFMADQEVKPSAQTGIAYYEGAIRVGGTREGRALEGEGYLEITGAPGQKKGATELGRAL